MENAIGIQTLETSLNPGILFQDQEIEPPYFGKSIPDTNVDDDDYVLIIDSRTLDRECLSRCLLNYNPSLHIVTSGSVEEWYSFGRPIEPSVIIMILGSRSTDEAEMCKKIADLTEAFKDIPIVLIAENDSLNMVLKAVECGAKGYIPSSVSIGVAAEAIALARAGGVFIPASSILAVKDLINSVGSGGRFSDLFTAREIQVAEALRRGKANKIIAYEMELCESTVKVHIRNIMKKLHASNRTEVAFKLRGLMR
jgi:DNA-binding NarL/FixJ family response regulator